MSVNVKSTPTLLLPLNAHSILRDDVDEIRHLPEVSAVQVRLQGRRCPFPVLRGRLSGPAIVVLKWERDADGALLGRYKVPTRGVYFFEVIVLFCSQFQRNWSQSMVKDTCVEDVRRHRLTSRNATILVTHHAALSEPGQWVGTGDSSREGFQTRTQPNGCVNPFCNVSDFTQFPNVSGYEFAFHDSLRVTELIGTSVLCFVGASHSRFAKGHLQKSLPSYADQIKHIEAQFPRDLHTASSDAHVNNCTHIIIGIGQWDAGWPEGAPTSFSEYESSMKSGLANFTGTLARVMPFSRVFVRSMHENPLGNRISACPPGDWRNPEVVRVYNEILLSVTQELSMPFLDTTDIIMPLWDTAADWCHYEGEAGRVDALYLAQRALAHNF